MDSERKKESSHAFNFLEGQNLLALNPLIFIEGHAVGTPEVASVRDGDSEVTHGALKQVGRGHVGDYSVISRKETGTFITSHNSYYVNLMKSCRLHKRMWKSLWKFPGPSNSLPEDLTAQPLA